ncbi:MAG: uracil-DNA glycosylase [Rhodothermales bacterium]|nr:uracil-DNA glycosylase [Rhodothermales bacterium]
MKRRASRTFDPNQSSRDVPTDLFTEFHDLRAALEAQIELFGRTVPFAPASESERESESERKSEPVPESTSATADTGRSPAPVDASPYDRIAGLIPEDSPLRGFRTLEEVSDWVANTVLIPLDETRTKPVFGVGNPEADLLVIGEAPGRDEDLQGEPFVGRAGKLLDDILAAIEFDRNENVYIANILKSRPPNNRNPEASEVLAHLPILHKQISLIRPKVILCVGKTAGTSLLNIDSTLGAMRGTFHDYHGLPVLVTYHPAALLRNPNWKRPTWEDVKLLRHRYEELTSAPGTDG